jgi:hypothetical protein
MLNVYRLTIVISTVFWLILWFLPFFDFSSVYSQEELNLLMWDGWNSKLQISITASWLIFSAWLLCSIGLFFTIKYTRECFVFVIIGSTLLSFFQGFRVVPPIDGVLLNLVTMADGAVIYMAYFSSISKRFK